MVQELTNTNANATIVNEIYAAYARGDVDAVLARLDPGIKMFSPTPFGGDMNIESFPIFLEQVATRANGTLKLHPVDTLVSANRVAVLMEISLTTNGTDHLVKAIHLWELENGKAVSWRELAYIPQQFVDVWA